MRLVLALTAVLIASPVMAGPRCMAMAHVRTVDRTGATTLRDAETIGPVDRVEGDAKGLWLCGENRTCWPAADFDLVTPCTPEALQGKMLKLR